MGAKHIGNAIFIDDHPITPKDWSERKRSVSMKWNPKTKTIISWLDKMGPRAGIYPYAEFLSSERASIGVALVVDGRIRDKTQIKEIQYNEPQGLDVMEISDIPDGRAAYVYEEYPFVNVQNRKDFDRLLESHHESYPQWAEVERDYNGPGVYDAREMSRDYDSPEQYELAALEEEADQLIEYIFSGGLLSTDLEGEEWIKAFEQLLVDAEERGEAREEEEEADEY